MPIWHNGEWKAEGAAVFSAADRVRLGDGVFDTMLAVGGRLCHAGRHYARLIAGAAVFGISPDFSEGDFVAVAQELLHRAGLKTGRAAVNTIITRGNGERGLMPPEVPDLQIVMRVSKVPEVFPPVHAVMSSVKRNEGSPLSRMKSLNYGDNILALLEAQRRGGNEAILCSNAGFVACSSAGNIVLRRPGGALVTPPLEDGAMAGVARALLMERHGVREERLLPGDLKGGGVFIVNSIRGLCPVVSLDGAALTPKNSGISKDFHVE